MHIIFEVSDHIGAGKIKLIEFINNLSKITYRIAICNGFTIEIYCETFKAILIQFAVWVLSNVPVEAYIGPIQ